MQANFIFPLQVDPLTRTFFWSMQVSRVDFVQVKIEVTRPPVK